ncbi:hypothetical protein [Pandoraea commovens]|uniref:Uncharacterized protein n=1 Tax=Pandoraea commovens TaxID=2508289 RepID=A0A5E4T295_9BURK|nr:hypothetical protein [Pandoraea commovens]VVD81093.1 hypothetical protein PCO31010_01148 [Pandoraea commovens]
MKQLVERAEPCGCDHVASRHPIQKRESARFTGISGISDNRPVASQHSAIQAMADRHSTRSAMPVSNAPPIQRVVTGGRNGRPYRSSEVPGREFPTYEQAKAAEEQVRRERAEQAQRERPPVNFQFQPPTGPVPTPENPLSAALHQYPAHFGPVLTTGGQVHQNQVGSVMEGGSAFVTEPGKTAFSGQNTYAVIMTNGPDDNRQVFNPTGQSTSLSSLPGTSPFAFHKQNVFMQGRPPQGVTLPPGRKTAHAEALAVHSQGFEKAVEKNATDLNNMASMMGIDTERVVPDDPTEDDMEYLSSVLGMPGVTTDIVENRASCGKFGESGFPGGCNQEMANTVGTYGGLLDQHLPSQFSFLAQNTGLASFGVSTAGPYTHQGNPLIITNAGGRVAPHNPISWTTSKPRHMGEELQAYIARSEPQNHVHDHDHDDEKESEMNEEEDGSHLSEEDGEQ